MEFDLQKFNQRYTHMCEKIASALFLLMDKKSFDDIGISELCESAGIARNSFYRNFGCVGDVVELEFDKMFATLAKRFDPDTARARDMLACIFEFIVGETGFGKVFINDEVNALVDKKIRECVELFFGKSLREAIAFDPMLSDYYIAFLASGIVAVFRTWVLTGYKQSPQAMATISVRLLDVVVT